MIRSLSGRILSALLFTTLAACASEAEVPAPGPAEEDLVATNEPSVEKSGEAPEGATPAPPASTSPAPPASTSPAPPAAVCGGTADAVSCVECCVEGLPKIDPAACLCAPASPCQAACGSTMCAGKVPDLACGQCLLQNGTKATQDCAERLAAGPKQCIVDSGCLGKAGAGDLQDLPLPFALP